MRECVLIIQKFAAQESIYTHNHRHICADWVKACRRGLRELKFETMGGLIVLRTAAITARLHGGDNCTTHVGVIQHAAQPTCSSNVHSR